MSDLCQCCLGEPSVGVAAVPGIPVSIAWGRKCLEAGVIPMWLAVGNTAMIGGMDAAAEWWVHTVDRTLEYFDVSREDFDQSVANEIEEVEAYFANEPQEPLDLSCWD